MITEIREEPRAVQDTLVTNFDEATKIVNQLNPQIIRRVYFCGSGTSYHACLAANYALSSFTKVFGSAIPASEFPHWVRQVQANETILIAMSQSGESSDIITAANSAKDAGVRVVALTNTQGSKLETMSDFSITSKAGEEKALAATKSYTAILAAAYLLVLELARHVLSAEYDSYRDEIKRIPTLIGETIELCEASARTLATSLRSKEFIFLLGTGPDYPTALEGALKVKECCNVHAEAFATREFLHGPVQLVDERTPIFMIEGSGKNDETIRLSESFERFGAPTIMVKPRESTRRKGTLCLDIAPNVPSVFSSLVHVIPLQLYAYYSSVARGLNPDRPGKLSKVVR